MPKASPIGYGVSVDGGRVTIDVRCGRGRFRRRVPSWMTTDEAIAMAAEARRMLATMTPRAVRETFRIREAGPRKKVAKPAPLVRRGSVYAIRAEGTDFVKIGFTRDGDVSRRMSSLATGCPVPLRLVFRVDATCRTEQAVHAALAHARTHGEWFRLTDDEAVEALRRAAS